MSAKLKTLLALSAIILILISMLVPSISASPTWPELKFSTLESFPAGTTDEELHKPWMIRVATDPNSGTMYVQNESQSDLEIVFMRDCREDLDGAGLCPSPDKVRNPKTVLVGQILKVYGGVQCWPYQLDVDSPFAHGRNIPRDNSKCVNTPTPVSSATQTSTPTQTATATATGTPKQTATATPMIATATPDRPTPVGQPPVRTPGVHTSWKWTELAFCNPQGADQPGYNPVANSVYTFKVTASPGWDFQYLSDGGSNVTADTEITVKFTDAKWWSNGLGIQIFGIGLDQQGAERVFKREPAWIIPDPNTEIGANWYKSQGCWYYPPIQVMPPAAQPSQPALIPPVYDEVVPQELPRTAGQGLWYEVFWWQYGMPFTVFLLLISGIFLRLVAKKIAVR